MVLNPRSRIRALALGGLEHLGWDSSLHALANLYDIIAAVGLGLSGKKLQDKDRYPRPVNREAHSEQAATTIADFNIDAFMAKLSG